MKKVKSPITLLAIVVVISVTMHLAYRVYYDHVKLQLVRDIITWNEVGSYWFFHGVRADVLEIRKKETAERFIDDMVEREMKGVEKP